MRFEAKHSQFECIVRHTGNLKNILQSLATKHQLMISRLQMSWKIRPRLSSLSSDKLTYDSCSLNLLSSERQNPWPQVFPIPTFSHNTELALRQRNGIYLREGRPLVSPSVKSDILEISIPAWSKLDHLIEHTGGSKVRNANVEITMQIVKLWEACLTVWRTHPRRTKKVWKMSRNQREINKIICPHIHQIHPFNERWPALFEAFQVITTDWKFFFILFVVQKYRQIFCVTGKQGVSQVYCSSTWINIYVITG